MLTIGRIQSRSPQWSGSVELANGTWAVRTIPPCFRGLLLILPPSPRTRCFIAAMAIESSSDGTPGASWAMRILSTSPSIFTAIFND